MGAGAWVLSAMFLLVSSASSARTKPVSVLMVLTGSDRLELSGGEGYKTGYWLEEFSVPYQVFEKAGLQVSVATPKGVRPSVDHGSVALGSDGKPLSWKTLEEMDEALALKKRVLDEGKIVPLEKLTKKDLAGFDAVFFPGGHGPMSDLIQDRSVARLLAGFHAAKKPTALVCHAPAVLVSTEKIGRFLYAGYKVTAFTDEEESLTPVGPKMKTTPEKELRRAGAVFAKKPAWEPYVVEDRELLTGQNPGSSRALAEALVQRLMK